MSLLRNAQRPYSHLDNDDELSKYLRHNRVQDRTPHFHYTSVIILVLLILILFIMVIFAAAFYTSHRSGVVKEGDSRSITAFEEALVVKTNCGEFVGTVEDGVFVFKGIPYAKPPVGHLRWKRPVPLWNDRSACERHERYKAYNYGPQCFQLNPTGKQYEGQEDCLYLNIWTPRLDASAGLRVMIWIHGGFQQFGNGNQPGLSPSGKVAKKLNTVFVSFNYRLHALGFMALDLLRDSFLTDTLGNYGLWDQITAMQWTQLNIKLFGGDPSKVTVFGPDSGAASILSIMSSKAISGLFQSAWLIGPAFVFNRTFKDVSDTNEAFFVPRSGCLDAVCLKKMTAKKVLGTFVWKDEPSFRIRDQNDLPIQGIFPEQFISVDEDLLDASPMELINGKKAEDIPILVGTAAQSINIWPGPDDLPKWSWRQLRKYVSTSLDSFGTRISHLSLQLYNSSDYNDFETPEEVYSTMVTDLRQTCAVSDLTDLMSQNFQSPVFRYILKSKPSSPIKLYTYPSSFSFHLWELIAFFDHLELFLKNPSEEDYAFRDLVQSIVLSFIRSEGASVGRSEWKPYPHSIALLTSNVSIIEQYHKTKCKFWAAQNFTEYAWVS